MRRDAGAGWLPGVHDDHGENHGVFVRAETPSTPTKEVLGNDQGTRGLREDRGDDCLGRG